MEEQDADCRAGMLAPPNPSKEPQGNLRPRLWSAYGKARDRALSAHQPPPRPALQYQPRPRHTALCALSRAQGRKNQLIQMKALQAPSGTGGRQMRGARPGPTGSAAGSQQPPRPAPVPSHPRSPAAGTGMGMPSAHHRAGSIQPVIKGEEMSQNPVSCRFPIKNNSRGANRQSRAGKKESETVWCQRFVKELKCGFGALCYTTAHPAPGGDRPLCVRVGLSERGGVTAGTAPGSCPALSPLQPPQRSLCPGGARWHRRDRAVNMGRVVTVPSMATGARKWGRGGVPGGAERHDGAACNWG